MSADLHAEDLLSIPGLLSVARVPLGLAYFGTATRPRTAFAILCAGAATDILDGWVARRTNQVTATGAFVDGVSDKVFALSVVSALYASDRLTTEELLWLSAREIGELPLALWMQYRPERIPSTTHTANALGKATTMFQFAAATAAMFDSRHTRKLAVAAGVLGIAACATYWWRALA